MKRDRVQELKDRLALIATQDTKLVVETNRALIRMAELGLSTPQVQAFLTEPPGEDYLPIEVDGIPSGVPPGGGFHGFASRRQASLAAFGSLSKKDWPAALQAGHERTNTLMKQQAPEATGSGVEQIIMMPMVMPEAFGPVMNFRRLKSGGLKEIASKVIDVQEQTDEEMIAAMEEKP
jgi:hypothetical protein